MERLRTVAAAAVVLALVLALAACESVSIGRLTADPSHWQGKRVHVHGTVEDSYGALGHGAYLVSDGTGKIWVISGKGLPSRGARVDVEGDVFQGAELMGRSVGMALKEIRHHSH
jgi:hypothetical protein